MRSNVYLRDYKTKKGERRFYLVVREYGRREKNIQLGPVSRRVAEERRHLVLHELLTGAYRSEPEVHLYFSEMVERFFSDFAVGSRALGTIQSYQDHLKLPLQRFKGWRLNQIQRHDIEKHFASWPVSGRTKNICLSVLRLLFTKAVEWKYLAKSPMEGIKRFPESSQGSRALSPAELSTLWDGLTTWQKSVIRIMVYSGMRPGEVTNLKFRDVDWELKRLAVANDKTRQTKNRRTRHIPMNADLREELLFLRDFLPVQGRCRKIHHGGKDYLPRQAGQKDYVFCNEDGSRVKCIRGSVTRALKKHGFQGVSPHGLRKTFCTQLARFKTHPKVAQTLMGHSDVSLTMRVYTEIDDQQLREAVDQLPTMYDLQRGKFQVVDGGKK